MNGVEVASRNLEVERIHVIANCLAVTPGAQQSADRAGILRRSHRVDDLEARATFRRRRHQVRAKRFLTLFVADLADAHVSRLRLRLPGECKQRDYAARHREQLKANRGKAWAGKRHGSLPAAEVICIESV